MHDKVEISIFAYYKAIKIRDNFADYFLRRNVRGNHSGAAISQLDELRPGQN